MNAPRRTIGVADIVSLGGVDDALAAFCDDQFVRTAAATRASEASIRNWVERDLLSDPTLPRLDYQLIVMVRFVAAELLTTLTAHLRPGGYLLVEEHLRWPEPVAGPGSDRFRVAPGELRSCTAGLDVVDTFEGTVTDPDGATSAVARIVAQKPA